MKVGIVGAGMIVKDCLNAFNEVSSIELICISCLEHEKEVALQLMDKHGIKKIYTNYHEMLQDNEVDTVYLGITNILHYSFAKEALLAGKNVICEKPFTSTVNEARELLEIAKNNKKFLFEAINTVYHPNYLRVKEEIKKLKDLKLFRTNYSQYSSRYSDYLQGKVLPVFDPKLGGGSIVDINYYNIHLAVGLFGKPKSCVYYANKGFNGIDTSGILIMQYDRFIVECVGAKDSTSPCESIIQGENGYIRINGSPNILESVDVCIDKQMKHYDDNQYKHRLTCELIAFNEMINNSDYEQCYSRLIDTINVIEIVETAREQAGIVFD